MVTQTAILVKQNELQRLLDSITTEEQEVITDLEKIIPFVKNEKMRKSLESRLERGKEGMRALQAGFVPVDQGWFTRVDTKNKWNKSVVKSVLSSMPIEVKDLWDKVKEKGIFESFSVSTSGGDPLLVGNIGRKHYFLAGWLEFRKGYSLGIKIKI